MSPRPIAVDVVSFDYWNTLLHESHPGSLVEARLPHMFDQLRGAGHERSMEALRRAHDAAQAEFEASASVGVIFETPQAAATMARALQLPEALVDLVNEGFSAGSAVASISTVPGVPEVLASLREANIRLAIVCDVGLTPSPVLIDWLRERDLADYFDAMAFSDQIGEYKPASRMFDWVLGRLAAERPDRVLHIGDRRRTDVAGARARGLRSVRFAGVFDDDQTDMQDADVVIDHMPDLLDILGIG